jgi:outer membrane receptor for ferrienterochelin and colicin
MRRWLWLWLALCWPVQALADARVEARRHFKTGMFLIGEGKLDEGISELLEAYRVKPHPNVLFNIGRAHERAGRPADALAFYRRYLAVNPPDGDAVRDAVAGLERQLPQKADSDSGEGRPPAAPSGATASAAVEDSLLRRLQAVAERLERAAPQHPEATSPQALAKAAPPLAADSETNRDLPQDLGPAAGSDDFVKPYEETVVAAARRSQSTLEAANAITIITGEEVRLSGLQHLPDVLRRVPGAEVMALGASSFNVSFRGFNQRGANKVLVLVDGRPEYQDFLGVTLWPAFPVGVEEIDRIEVIRGPGSALYGANAMLGVVNIITRPPGTGAAAEFSALGGTGGLGAASVVASGGERLKYRASAGYQQADKHSVDYAAGRSDVASTRADPDLALRGARANLVTHLALGRDLGASASGGVSHLFTEVNGIGLLRNYFLEGTTGYAKADFTTGPLKLRFFWNHLDAVAGPQYEPNGQRSLVSRIDSNVFDLELMFQREFTLLGTHLFGAGVSGRLKRVSWDYLRGFTQETHAAAFVQDEWRVLKSLSVVASYRVDRHPLLDQGKPGLAHSPRLSLVSSPFEGHAFRGSVSSAFRQPTYLESYTDLRVPVAQLNGASVLTQGNLGVKPEQLLSFELGYRGEAARLGLSWDLALYWNVVSDLVVLSAVSPLPAGQAWDARSGTFLLGRSTFINDPASYTARGAEAGATWNATRGLDVRASAALQHIAPQQALAVCGPCSQAPVVKLNAGFSYRTPVQLDLSADLSYVSGTTWVEREPSPSNPAQVVNLENALTGYTSINARIAYRLLGDRVSVAVVGSQLGPSHQEHPFGNSMTRRVFAILKVTP